MELETERLILRKPRLSDWKDLVDSLNDEETLRYTLTMPFPFTKDNAVKYIRNLLNLWNNSEGSDFPFFVELKSERKIIGHVY